MNDVAHPALRPLGTGAVLVSLALCLASAAGVLLDESLSELRLYLDVSVEANLPT